MDLQQQAKLQRTAKESTSDVRWRQNMPLESGSSSDPTQPNLWSGYSLLEIGGEQSFHLKFDICCLRTEGDEDVDHILMHCSKARETWKELLPPSEFHVLSCLNLQDWITANLCSSPTLSINGSWPTKFAVTCWQLWKQRCNLLFNENHVDKENFVDLCLRLAREYENFKEQTNAMHNVSRTTETLWKCPQLGWIKEIIARHISRSANGVADNLAKLNRNMPNEEFLFTDPPTEALAALLEDLCSNT
ncbi:hypothetical protein V6N11_054560 [Hibiscus sabdariffa]|uniref:RNase H type-1 domain-containing protein n=1 Tax=Hibiscus sabdariffa TaxID=183260 RepID=A0ABR2S498_9ROSI